MKTTAEMVAETTVMLNELAEEYYLSEWFKGMVSTYGEANHTVETPDNISIYSGCTRVVIVNDDWDYVVKIQYTDFDHDYGAREAAVYEKAVERGLGEFFAECRYLMPYQLDDRSFKVYVMEKCDVDSDKTEAKSYKYHFASYCDCNDLDENDENAQEAFANSCESSGCGDESGMFEYLETEWGYINVGAVCQLLSEMAVDDMHSGNFGWIGDRIVCTDYAGYNTWEERE